MLAAAVRDRSCQDRERGWAAACEFKEERPRTPPWARSLPVLSQNCCKTIEEACEYIKPVPVNFAFSKFAQRLCFFPRFKKTKCILDSRYIRLTKLDRANSTLTTDKLGKGGLRVGVLVPAFGAMALKPEASPAELVQKWQRAAFALEACSREPPTGT